MPSEIYDPRDVKLGDTRGGSVNNESLCIAKITLTVMQSLERQYDVIVIPVVDRLDWVTDEDILKSYDILRNNQIETMRAIKEYEEERKGSGQNC